MVTFLILDLLSHCVYLRLTHTYCPIVVVLPTKFIGAELVFIDLKRGLTIN